MGNALGSCVVFSQSMCEKKPQNKGGAGMILHMHGKHMKTPKSEFNARKGSAFNPNLAAGLEQPCKEDGYRAPVFLEGGGATGGGPFRQRLSKFVEDFGPAFEQL